MGEITQQSGVVLQVGQHAGRSTTSTRCTRSGPIRKVRHYLWDDEEISRKRAAEAVEHGVAAANRTGVGLWCVLPKPASAPAGFCGFRYIDEAPDIELLYGLLPDYWGQGLATEACARTCLTAPRSASWSGSA